MKWTHMPSHISIYTLAWERTNKTKKITRQQSVVLHVQYMRIRRSIGFRQIGQSWMRSPHNWQHPWPHKKIMFLPRSRQTGQEVCGEKAGNASETSVTKTESGLKKASSFTAGCSIAIIKTEIWKHRKYFRRKNWYCRLNRMTLRCDVRRSYGEVREDWGMGDGLNYVQSFSKTFVL